MNDPNVTADIRASSLPPDSLDAGLAAGFGRPGAPRSSLGDLRPLLLKEAEGESAHIVRPTSDAMPPKEETGDRYQLSGEIARGGMGAILRGRDVDLGRDLAIKVLLEKYANRPDVARRFVEEAQIGGQLQHPGVVPVYDIGHFGDRPFFTMKLVKGQTLSANLGKREDPSGDRPRLLGIALQVAQTLAYAHAKGVIHRDLKPANIMVGAFGEVQVMDWGLAKVLAEGGVADEERASRTHQKSEDVTHIRTARSSGTSGSFGTDTEAGSMLGTPAYMPPEQANGDIANLDRRADVFGLGAILCEILTGKPPYVGRSGDEVRRKAANGDLADATARLDGCGADADLIALTKRCLSPEAIDRPKDAQEVADSLTAYLNGVQDRLKQAELDRVQAVVRVAEERKRRRLTLALASTVLLALTLGGGGWLWLKSERDARMARVSHDVNEALNKAIALLEQARTAKAGSAALFAEAREQAQRAVTLLESAPTDTALQVRVSQLQTELDDEEKDRKLIVAFNEARLAKAKTVAGENRFATERALPMFQVAFQDYGFSLGEGEPVTIAQRIKQRPVATQEEIIAALDEWVSLANRNPDIVKQPQRAWLWEVLYGVESPEGWMKEFRAALYDYNGAIVVMGDAPKELAKTADVKKLPVRALIRLAEVLALLGETAEAEALLRRTWRQYPNEFWVNHDLGVLLSNFNPARYDEAIRFLSTSVALQPESAVALYNLSRSLYLQGNRDEAIACSRRIIELESRYPGAYNILGLALLDQDKCDEAIDYLAKAIEIDSNDANSHYNLGKAYLKKGKLDEAIASNRKAIDLNPTFALAYFNMGLSWAGKDKHDEAIASFRKSIEFDSKYANSHGNLGKSLNAKGQSDEAIACYKKAIELDPRNAATHNCLGAILCDVKHDYDGAIASFKRAIELDPKRATAHCNLGVALGAKGQLDEAIACYKKAIELDPKLANAHNNLGLALAGKGQLDKAIACYKKAIELVPNNADTHFNLGSALWGKGQVDEAIDCYKKSIALDPKNVYAQSNLGAILCDFKHDYDGAIACFETAIELDPKPAGPHFNLGIALKANGQLDKAIASYKKAIELDPKLVGAREGLAQAERLASARDKLPAYQNGNYTPASNAERLSLIEWCKFKKLHHAAVGLYAAAFAADPNLADELTPAHRYNAACLAALAAAGQGEDVAKIDDKERTRLRTQALAWLRADQALREKQLATANPADRAEVQQKLRYWQKDTDLASIRDAAALAKLPADQQKAFAQLWADVAAVLKAAEGKGISGPTPGAKTVEKKLDLVPPPREKK